MKQSILTFFGILGVVLSLSAQKEYSSIADMPLVEVLSILEAKNDILFSYDNDNISEQKISLASGQYTLQDVLDKVFKQTDLNFEFIDTKHILLNLKQNRSDHFQLCGYLKDKDSGSIISYASIYTQDKSRGVESDENGYFEMEVSSAEKKIFVSFLGYELLEIFPETQSSVPCTTYEMKVESLTFQPIILKEYLADGINRSENANSVVISPQEMDILPGSVEQDVLSAIQFLPGINSPSESLDAIHVRGGTPDQNLILWDGIPMYHTSHFFGTISAFNPFIIDRVHIHRSGIGSEYGGRVSSVIDIRTKEEHAKKFTLGAGFNLTHLNLDIEFPVWKNSTVIFSTRRSITDIWNTPTFVKYAEKVFQGTKIEDNNFNDPNLEFSDEFRFNDANFKWKTKVGCNTFTFSSFGAVNSLNYKTDVAPFNAYSVDLLDLTNTGAGLSWERQWKKSFKSKLEFTNTEYRYDYSLNYFQQEDRSKLPFLFASQNSITDGGLLWSNQWKMSKSQNLKFGYQFTENRIRIDLDQVNRQDTTGTKEIFENKLHSLFGEYTLKVPDFLQIDIGLRYQYQENIGNNYFEPRIALVTNINDLFKLKLSTGKHFQFISQLIVFDKIDLGLSNQIWVAANNTTIPVIESNQWMGGFVYQKGTWTLDVEGYVKELVGITSLSSSFGNLPNQPFSKGNSRTRGIDVMLKRRVGKYRNWLSYTLSQTRYEFLNLSSEPIPATHDQTHVLQWVHMYKRGSWEFSAGIQLKSGLPTTLAEGIELKMNPEGELIPKIVYGAPNAARLKNYSKIDASVIYHFGDPENLNGYVGFSIQNLTNRTNILGRRYILGEPSDLEEPKLVEITQIGLKWTPNLSVNIRLN